MTRLEYLKEVKKLLPTNPVCVEIGVYRGDFSKMILDELNPSNLILIDPFETNTKRTYGKDLDELPTAYSSAYDYCYVVGRFYHEIEFCKVDLIAKYSYDAAIDICNNSIDFIYIDACHLYEDVKRDLNDWYPKLREGGIIGGHDYTPNYKDYVCRAVDEFCELHGLKIVLLSDEGDFALK